MAVCIGLSLALEVATSGDKGIGMQLGLLQLQGSILKDGARGSRPSISISEKNYTGGTQGVGVSIGLSPHATGVVSSPSAPCPGTTQAYKTLMPPKPNPRARNAHVSCLPRCVWSTFATTFGSFPPTFAKNKEPFGFRV